MEIKEIDRRAAVVRDLRDNHTSVTAESHEAMQNGFDLCVAVLLDIVKSRDFGDPQCFDCDANIERAKAVLDGLGVVYQQ